MFEYIFMLIFQLFSLSEFGKKSWLVQSGGISHRKQMALVKNALRNNLSIKRNKRCIWEIGVKRLEHWSLITIVFRAEC